MAEGWLPFRQRDQPDEQSLDALLGEEDPVLLGMGRSLLAGVLLRA